MIIILTGGTGLIGQALGKKLSQSGYTLHVLTRSPQKKMSYPCKTFLWNSSETPPIEAFPNSGEDWGVIHLAGESISFWPWTPNRKKRIYESRILGTRNLIHSLKELSSSPNFFISASALGIYGTQKGGIVTESSPSLKSSSLFLEKVCKDWERETSTLNSSSCRTIILRFGMVLSSLGGGFLPYLYSAQKRIYMWSLKPLWINWIHIQDVVEICLWAIKQKSCRGIYNVTSPTSVTLNEFSKNLFQTLGVKALIPLPIFLLKWFGGEMAKNLLANVKVHPERLNKENYSFQYPTLKEALKDLLRTELSK